MISIDKKRKFDWTLFLSVISLVLLGTLAIMSSTIMLDFRERVIRTHIIAVFIGIFAMLFMWVFDYNMLDEHANKIYIFFLFLITDIYYLIKEKIKKSSVKHKKIIYRIEIGIAILIVVLSFFNTLFPVVKKYSISTEKESLKNKKIVLISDMHLSNNSIKFYWERKN